MRDARTHKQARKKGCSVSDRQYLYDAGQLSVSGITRARVDDRTWQELGRICVVRGYVLYTNTDESLKDDMMPAGYLDLGGDGGRTTVLHTVYAC